MMKLPENRLPPNLYPTPDVVQREVGLIEVALASGRILRPNLMVFGVDKQGHPYRGHLAHLGMPDGVSPVRVLASARERLAALSPTYQIRVALLAFEDGRGAERRVHVVIDGIAGFDIERRWRAATVLPPMFQIGALANAQTRNIGKWVELYEPVPTLFT